MSYEIRPVRAADDPVLARIIRTVMPEFGACGNGFAINDPEVDYMHRAYAATAPANCARCISCPGPAGSARALP